MYLQLFYRSMLLCVWLITTISFSRCKDTKVERNGKIYFDIPEMKYRRRARRAKDTDFLRNRQNFLSEARRIQRKGRKKRYGKGKEMAVKTD